MSIPAWWPAVRALGEPWPERPPTQPFVHGWTVHADELARLLRPGSEWAARSGENHVFVEIGSWTGKTASYLLAAYPALLLVAVDLWSPRGGVSHPEVPFPLWTWQANIWPYRDRAVAVQEWSEIGMLAIARAGAEPDVVYVDAGHDSASVYLDVATAAACFPRATICGDDWGLTTRGEGADGRSVGDAVSLYAKRRGRRVEARGNFWVLT